MKERIKSISVGNIREYMIWYLIALIPVIVGILTGYSIYGTYRILLTYHLMTLIIALIINLFSTPILISEIRRWLYEEKIIGFVKWLRRHPVLYLTACIPTIVGLIITYSQYGIYGVFPEYFLIVFAAAFISAPFTIELLTKIMEGLRPSEMIEELGEWSVEKIPQTRIIFKEIKTLGDEWEMIIKGKGRPPDGVPRIRKRPKEFCHVPIPPYDEEYEEDAGLWEYLKFFKSKILILVVLFVMIIVGNATFQYSETPEFCLNCHLMKPYYLSYENSPHKEVETCLECHYEPGIIGHIKGKLGGMKSLLQYITGMYEFPIESNISSDLCFRCHEPDIRVNLDGVEFNHEHLIWISKNTEECGHCHAGMKHKKVSHANCEECHSVHKNNTEITMETCFKCHNGRMATGNCSDCHKDVSEMTPENLPMPNMTSTDCLTCHSIVKKFKLNETNFDHDNHINREECTFCHRGKHENFTETSIEMKDCFRCHKNNDCLLCHNIKNERQTE